MKSHNENSFLGWLIFAAIFCAIIFWKFSHKEESKPMTPRAGEIQIWVPVELGFCSWNEKIIIAGAVLISKVDSTSKSGLLIGRLYTIKPDLD